MMISRKESGLIITNIEDSFVRLYYQGIQVFE